MNVPGVNLEDDPPAIEPDPLPVATLDDPDGHEDIDDPSIVETVTGTQGEKLVPLSALIDMRRASKAMKDENAALKQQQAVLGKQLEDIRPTLERLKADPRLLDQVQTETRPSAPQTVQPADDREAIEWAEENGLITATGELDVTRARRQLTRLEGMAERIADRKVGPLRQQNAQTTSENHRESAKRVTLKDGSKLASDESIDQAFGMLPPELTADSNVAALIPILAAGIDVVMGRRPAAKKEPEYGDPILSEAPGGGRRPSAISADTQKILGRLGVTEKEFRTTADKYDPSRPMRLE